MAKPPDIEELTADARRPTLNGTQCPDDVSSVFLVRRRVRGITGLLHPIPRRTKLIGPYRSFVGAIADDLSDVAICTRNIRVKDFNGRRLSAPTATRNSMVAAAPGCRG